MKIVYTATARRDLGDIANWIRAENPNHARRFVRELRDVCARLSTTPFGFPMLPRFAALKLRKRVYRDYLILYRVSNDIEIIRIVHGARDYEAVLLGDGEPN